MIPLRCGINNVRVLPRTVRLSAVDHYGISIVVILGRVLEGIRLVIVKIRSIRIDGPVRKRAVSRIGSSGCDCRRNGRGIIYGRNVILDIFTAKKIPPPLQK